MTTKSMMQVAFATLVAVVALSISGEKDQQTANQILRRRIPRP